MCVSKLLKHDLPGSSKVDGNAGMGARLVAVDLLPMEPVPHCHFIEGSFTSAAVRAAVSAALLGRGCHVHCDVPHLVGALLERSGNVRALEWAEGVAKPVG